jgi:hypothetical protein
MPTESEKHPCPWCGSTRIKYVPRWHRLRCLNCFAMGPVVDHYRRGPKEPEARRLWNERSEEK